MLSSRKARGGSNNKICFPFPLLNAKHTSRRIGGTAVPYMKVTFALSSFVKERNKTCIQMGLRPQNSKRELQSTKPNNLELGTSYFR
jgi:hypothetical protein